MRAVGRKQIFAVGRHSSALSTDADHRLNYTQSTKEAFPRRAIKNRGGTKKSLFPPKPLKTRKLRQFFNLLIPRREDKIRGTRISDKIKPGHYLDTVGVRERILKEISTKGAVAAVCDRRIPSFVSSSTADGWPVRHGPTPG